MSNFRFRRWPAESRAITQHFGENPHLYVDHNLPGHEGVDFHAPVGTKVFSVAVGQVRHVFHDLDHPYGINVRVAHADGYETIYAHLHEAHVQPGQQVRAGQILGLAGETGRVFGAHLHLTLKREGETHPGYRNNIINPWPFLSPLLEPGWNDATYLGETVPDGTVVQPEVTFVQTWTLANTGNATWDAGCTLRHVGGEAIGATQSTPLPPILPGAQAPVTVLFRSPAAAGRYRSVWQPHDGDGDLFGTPIWVEIEVPGLVAVSPGMPAPVPAEVSADFVQRRGRDFWLHGQPFRFMGLNLRGLAHYGRRSSDPLHHSHLGHRESQLRHARDLGARVVRFFVADKDASPQEIEERMRQVVDLVKQNFPEIYLIPIFTNLYNDVPFFVSGDEGFFVNYEGMDLLNRDFFAGGYRQNYLPLVERIVTTFRHEPQIFAWEIGNELKLDRGDKGNPDDPNPQLFIRFNLEVAAAIKRLDPHHLVTTGMKSTHHAWLHTPALQDALYTSPNIDFITIHSYKGGNDIGDQRVYDDAPLAIRLHKPFLVEETGIDKRFFDDRIPHYRDHMQEWFDLGAGGYMPWGFNHDHQIGDGDRFVGFDIGVGDFHDLAGLFREMVQRFTQVARSLAPVARGLAVPESGAPAAATGRLIEHLRLLGNLGGIYESYLARLSAALEQSGSQAEVEAATHDALSALLDLLDRYAEDK
jgi:hypothetical protein